MDRVVKRSADIDVDWLNEALKSTGQLKSSVSRLTVESIGAGVGLMGELARLKLEYAGEESLPSSIIAKCAAQNENRAVAHLLDFYNREVNFYNRIGNDCGFQVPESHYGAVDQESYDCILLLEDLGDVSPRDQIEGASEADAYAAIEKIAIMHGKFWEKVNTSESSWMYDMMSVPESEKLRDTLYKPSLEPTFEKFDSFFNDKTRQLCRTIGDNFSNYWSYKTSDFKTFVHGDYRQDNFIYKNEGDTSAIVMDWQISGKGTGIFDFTYFMTESLQPELRLRIEQDLLRLYVDRLAQAGVSGYDFDTAFRDYRILTLGCMVYPITVCGSLNLANERGRALAECLLSRNLQAIEELNCVDLL